MSKSVPISQSSPGTGAQSDRQEGENILRALPAPRNAQYKTSIYTF